MNKMMVPAHHFLSRATKLMRMLLCILVALSLEFGMFASMSSPALASQSFSQAYLQLDRLQANTPLSGTLCAKPSSASAGTEGKIAMTFPSDFTINTTLSNWTTDTSNLPVNGTAWPGISANATAVSGKTVTFTSGDLTSGSTLYCFHFQAYSSTSGSAGNKIATVASSTSGNTLINSTNVSLPIVTSDQIAITATVPANPTDFSASITRITNSDIITADQDIEYEVTYGSLLAYDTGITVEASWSLGTVAGSGIPTVDLLQYVTGSATKAYNNAVPVIDPVNRTISWTIPSFPGNTTGTVRFKLHTKNTYSGKLHISFDTSGRVLGPGTATPYSTVTTDFTPTALITPIPGPTSTPGPQPTATPTPTPSGPPPRTRIDNVQIQTISAKEAHIVVTTTNDTTMAVAYGTSPTSLDKTITSLSPQKRHTIIIPDLVPGTQYYFKITALDSTRRQITSDLFTFTTARDTKVPTIAADKVIATSEKVLLLTADLDQDNNRTVVIPEDSVFEMQIPLTQDAPIKTIQLFLRDKNVLGIATYAFADEAVAQTTNMLEVKPGVFAGRLMASNTPGMYEVYVRIQDYNGNIAEEKVSDVKVTKPFMVLEKGSNNPIERAKVSLYLYNETSKTYEFISPQSLPIQNPIYSEPDGKVNVILPQGQYRAEVEGIQNDKQTIDFTIGPNPGEEYPTVYLLKAPFSIGKTITYFITTCGDVLSSSHDFLFNLSTSERFFELNMLLILACFVILSVFALAGRLHVPVHQLPTYFTHLLFLHPKTGMAKELIKGQVIDHETDRPVSDADIFVLDTSSGQILLHTVTDRQGKFSFPILPIFTYRMEIEKASYHPGNFHIQTGTDGQRVFSLVHHGTPLTLRQTLTFMTESVLGMSLELLLLLSFVLSLLLGYTFGFQKVLPFLVLALCNLVFWLLHRQHSKLYA